MCFRHSRGMGTLRQLVASLGSPGAVRNVEQALAARREADHAVDVLLRRLAPPEAPDVVTPAA